MEKIEKISDKQLKITKDVINYIDKFDLENEKDMLESRLTRVNILLDNFIEGK